MTKNLHKEEQMAHEREKDLFSRLEVPSSPAKEEVWAHLSQQLGQAPSAKKQSIGFWQGRSIWLSAAALTLLLSLGLFARFQTTSIHCPKGIHMSTRLPDGSVVEMNAESSLTYHPYWWWASRSLAFDGEGFFRVIKGKSFTVSSPMGETTVLGTSFNIYSRNEAYKVSCITGKVKVVSQSNEEVILQMNEQASIRANGSIEKTSQPNRTLETAWTRKMFHFTATPLPKVLEEMERQYDVSIGLSHGSDFIYTGFFSRKQRLEESLKLVCKPFGLTFVKESDKRYTLTKK